MNTKGIFWYSNKQRNRMGRHWKNYAKLDNGDIAEYTEWMSGNHINEKSNWDDATCLGAGDFYKHEED